MKKIAQARDKLEKTGGFGKWTAKSKKERKGRNPQTGEDVTIAARKVVTFKEAPKLRSEINRGSHDSKGG